MIKMMMGKYGELSHLPKKAYDLLKELLAHPSVANS